MLLLWHRRRSPGCRHWQWILENREIEKLGFSKNSGVYWSVGKGVVASLMPPSPLLLNCRLLP
jgi:hypothetical protein